jgi:hypothetical protein
MKIYIVYYNDGMESVLDKVFKNEKSAREYVDHKNKTSDYLEHWKEEWEVEE